MVRIRDVYSCLPQNKNRNDSMFGRYIMRPISIVLTVPFLELGISANAVSYISLVVAVIGIAATAQSFILGGLLLLLWMLLDGVDGNIARYVKKKSDYGDFIDSTSSLFIVLGILPAMAWNCIGSIDDRNKAMLVLGIAVGVGIVVGFSRIIYQKFRVVSLETGVNVGVTSSKLAMQEGVSKKSISYLANRVEKNFGITGFFLPLLISSDVFGFKLIFLSAFAVYSAATSIAVVLMIFIRVNRHEKMLSLLKE